VSQNPTSPTPDPQPPLAGVTVLEVGVFMAAPFASMQLADLGARVIKIEDPRSGDPVRASGPFLDGESSPYLRLNRNKESVALDLKSPAGKDAFLALVAQADVVIENLRPGAMARLGLAAEGIWAVNPRVVYASGSGWGQDGPLAPLPGLDIMAQARSGIMSITGTPGGEPVKVGVPVCDLVCGLYLALGVTAALRERDRIGVGQAIDVSLFEAGVSLAVWEAGKYFATGEVGGPLGSAHQSQAPYQAFQTSDGWVTIGANTPNTWAGLCRTLDMADELADEGYGDATRRHARRGELLDVIESRTRTRTTADLLAALGEAGVPCAPINDYGQVFTDDHLTARNFFWDAPHPALGPVRQIGSPMRLSRSPAVRGVAGPPLGADTRAVLARYGVPADVVDAIAGPAGTPDTAPTDEAVAVPRHPQPPAPGEGA